MPQLMLFNDIIHIFIVVNDGRINCVERAENSPANQILLTLDLLKARRLTSSWHARADMAAKDGEIAISTNDDDAAFQTFYTEVG